jgi:hypothetical protein
MSQTAKWHPNTMKKMNFQILLTHSLRFPEKTLKPEYFSLKVKFIIENPSTPALSLAYYPCKLASKSKSGA